MIPQEHSENTADFRCNLCFEPCSVWHVLQTWGNGSFEALVAVLLPELVGAFGAPWRLSHPDHHCCLCIPIPCGPVAAATAMQWLLKHPQSLFCFTVANRDTVLHVSTGKAKRLGYLIILPLGSGDPAEPQDSKCFSLPFLICLPSTSTTAKDCNV